MRIHRRKLAGVLIGFLLRLNHRILHNKIVADILKDPDKSYVAQQKIGSFLKQKVFEPGASYHWNDMIEKATAEKLTAKYFVEQFVKDPSMEEIE